MEMILDGKIQYGLDRNFSDSVKSSVEIEKFLDNLFSSLTEELSDKDVGNIIEGVKWARRLGNTEEALEAIEDLIDDIIDNGRSPELWAEAMLCLSRINIQIGEFEDVEWYLDSILEGDVLPAMGVTRFNFPAYYLLSLLHFRQAQFREAKNYIGLAKKAKDKDSPSFLLQELRLLEGSLPDVDDNVIELNPKRIFDSKVEQLFQEPLKSQEEMNRALGKINDDYNSMPIADFLGLSPSQVGELCISLLGEKNSVVNLEIGKKSIPLVRATRRFKMAQFVLEKISEGNGLKATAKGNLPRKLVQEFYFEFLDKGDDLFKPNKEDDCPSIGLLREILEHCAYIKKRKNKFTVTEKGKKYLSKEGDLMLYEDVLKTHSNVFDWDSLGGYEAFPTIQSSLNFHIWLLHKTTNEFISGKELAEFFMSAFPSSWDQDSFSFDGKKSFIRCFKRRLLDDFGVEFGLLDKKLSTKSSMFEEPNEVFYKKTELFDQIFDFS